MNKKYNKIMTGITTLTPKKAQSLLDGQFEEKDQRKISKPHLLRYADALNRGLWLFDAMPIRVDWFGRMFDGQHRCKAVLRAGKSMKVLIVYGLDPEVYKVCDRGKPRAFRDALKRCGETYYSDLASALTLLFMHKNGGGYRGGGSIIAIQTQDILDLLKENPLLRLSVKRAQPAKPILSPSIGTFLHYVFSQKNIDQADVFFDRLASGEGLKKKDPIGVLRDRLMFNKSETIKMEREYKIAIAFKAWNVFRQHGVMTKLSWRGPKRPEEPMPKVA